jgi:hypothetical protein
MRLYVLALLGASVSCHAMISSTPPVPPAAALSRYNTFSFALPGQPPAGYDVSERSIEAEARARQAIVAALVHRGYAEESAKSSRGDLIVRLSSGTREMTPFDGESGYRPAPLEEANVTIDFFDATSAALVGHGVAIADYDPPRVDVAQLQVSVLTAIEPVPAGGPDRGGGLERGVVRNDERGPSTNPL